MLSLVPVLLLIAFQGPAALERLSTSERLPEALRALERVLCASRNEDPTDVATVSCDEGSSVSGASHRFASLAADAALCAAIAQILSLEFADPAQRTPGLQSRLAREFEPGQDILADERLPIEEGFLQNRRTRAGPRA